MSSSIPIIQSLTSITNSSYYCQPITLFNKMQHFADYKCQFEHISNNIQIAPPYIWFNIEETKCFKSIKNDIERSRVTKQGLLSTNIKGNVLNNINYNQRQEDIGTIQQNQQCFSVAFAVVKDSCQQFLKLIGSQLRACLVSKSSLIDRSHLKISQLDQISKQIYYKYRVFLIFDTKSQPGRVVCFHSCFYPNVHFKLQKIKQKQGFKFGPNQALQQIQRGQLLNTYGFLSLDKKHRLLPIKKDDPQLRSDNIIGMWVTSTYSSNRTKKQFSKQDAIWIALMDFYTNQQIRNKLSIIIKQKGFLCYFGFRKQRSKLDIPQFYLFQANLKYQPKWAFSIKNQVLSQTNKSCEIKIQFINSTIVQQRQYSQFSDQTNNYQEQNKIKNQNINRQNNQKQITNQFNKNYSSLLQKNQSCLSSSSLNQEKFKDTSNQSISKINKQQDQKTKIIKQLKAELEKYKQRCVELQAINKVLMQDKMMMYSNQYVMMNQMHPPALYHQYGQIPNYSYPLSYSQVSSKNNFQNNPNQTNYQEPTKVDYYKQNSQVQIQPQISPINQITSDDSVGSKKFVNDLSYSNNYIGLNNIQQVNQNQGQKVLYAFPQQKKQQITFGTENTEYPIPKNKIFGKKSQSYGPDIKNQQAQKIPAIQEIKQKDKMQSNYINARKDVRNISFQDSFAQYHSQDQQEGTTFKAGGTHFLSRELQKTLKNNQFESSKKKPQQKDSDEENTQNFALIKSPQFKRINSKSNQSTKIQDILKMNANIIQKNKQTKNEQFQPKNYYKCKQQPIYKDTQTIQFGPISPKSPTSLKRNIQIEIPKKVKKIQSSNQSEEQHQPYSKIKPKQILKPKKNEQNNRQKRTSSSDDSDQDPQMKKMREIYLK